MRIIVEIEGERHRLLKGSRDFVDPCDKCSLRKECKGRYNKNADLLHEVCHITYSGYRKVKK